MTVDELNGGAAAPADTTAVADTSTDVALNSGTEPSESARSAIDKAFDAVDAIERGETVEKKPVATDTLERNADGTFKGKDVDGQQQEHQQDNQQQDKPDLREAPARFASDAEAKAGWAQTPDAVKGAIHRSIRELEAGIERYRGDATVFNQVFRPYVELALNSQQDPGALLKTYVDIDMALAQDFGAGLQHIFARSGQDPRAWAQAILGQQGSGDGQQQSAVDLSKDRTIQRLQHQIEALSRGVGGITESMAQGRVDQSLASFTGGLADTDKTLFAELDNEIAAILNSDPNISLPDAFQKAKGDAHARYARIFGAAPSDGARQQLTTTTAARAQTPTPGNGGSDPRRGQLSVSGAPGPGNKAGSKVVPTSPREALDNAFASLGL